MSQRMRVVLLVGPILVSIVANAFGQRSSATAHLDGGIHLGSFTRYGEGWHGSTRAYGGWLGAGSERFRLEVDFNRSRTLRQRGTACIDNQCRMSAAGTGSQRNMTWGVNGLLKFRGDGYLVPHVLAGFGELMQKFSYDFDNAAVEDQSWRGSWRGAVTGGAGFDFALLPRISGRAQYRLYLVSLDTTVHQFRLGFGLHFLAADHAQAALGSGQSRPKPRAQSPEPEPGA